MSCAPYDTSCIRPPPICVYAILPEKNILVNVDRDVFKTTATSKASGQYLR